MKLYEISVEGEWIRCLICGLTSYNPNDVAHHYCGNCHRYLKPPEELSAQELREEFDYLAQIEHPEQEYPFLDFVYERLLKRPERMAEVLRQTLKQLLSREGAGPWSRFLIKIPGATKANIREIRRSGVH